MAAAFDDYTLKLARKRVDAFDALTEQHRHAMKCQDCQDLLRSGIEAYKWLRRADETIRLAAVEGFQVSQDVVATLSNLYRAWLKPCPYAEEQVKEQEKLGFKIASLDEFRKVCEEVRTKVSILDMEEHLENAFQGGVFDSSFWAEAHKIRATQ